MIMMTAEEAFLAYEAVRHRLPETRPPGKPCDRVEPLADTFDRFAVFLLDPFGVLNIGETAIPGACARVARLREAGKGVMVVSNAASVPVSDLVAKYRRLGYPFEAADIVTSRATMAGSMHGASGIRWGVMGGGGGMADLGEMSTVPLGDDPRDYRGVGGFLMIGSGSWTDARQDLLERALRDNPRPVLVANPDIVAPREAGFTAEPGHFAHRLADRSGIEPRFFGKPFPGIYDLVFDRLSGVDKSRVVMVGDSLHTDILGAQAAGVASALVAQYGFFAGRDVAAAIERSGIRPDFILDRP